MTHTWESLRQSATQKGENNDCTVRALAVTTGLPYDDCHAAMAKRGRKKGRGTNIDLWTAAAGDLGFKLVDVTAMIRGRTIKTASRQLPRGRKFVLRVRGHVAGFDGREVVDWAKGRMHKIRNVFEVVAIEGFRPEIPTGVLKTPPPRVNRIETVVSKKRPFNSVLMVPPPRVNREKWIHEVGVGRLDGDAIGVVELKGDAAVAVRKATGLRGKVWTLFWRVG